MFGRHTMLVIGTAIAMATPSFVHANFPDLKPVPNAHGRLAIWKSGMGGAFPAA